MEEKQQKVLCIDVMSMKTHFFDKEFNQTWNLQYTVARVDQLVKQFKIMNIKPIVFFETELQESFLEAIKYKSRVKVTKIQEKYEQKQKEKLKQLQQQQQQQQLEDQNQNNQQKMEIDNEEVQKDTFLELLGGEVKFKNKSTMYDISYILSSIFEYYGVEVQFCIKGIVETMGNWAILHKGDVFSHKLNFYGIQYKNEKDEIVGFQGKQQVVPFTIYNKLDFVHLQKYNKFMTAKFNRVELKKGTKNVLIIRSKTGQQFVDIIDVNQNIKIDTLQTLGCQNTLDYQFLNQKHVYIGPSLNYDIQQKEKSVCFALQPLRILLYKIINNYLKKDNKDSKNYDIREKVTEFIINWDENQEQKWEESVIELVEEKNEILQEQLYNQEFIKETIKNCLISEKDKTDAAEKLDIRKYNINVHLIVLNIINIARKYLEQKKINFIQYDFIQNHSQLFNFNKDLEINFNTVEKLTYRQL